MGNCLKLQRGAASWVDDDEWEEEEVGKGMAAVERMERVEVKIRVTRRQLQELLEKAGKGRQVEKVLAELMSSGKVCYQQEMRGHWRPSLQSIPEAADEVMSRHDN